MNGYFDAIVCTFENVQHMPYNHQKYQGWNGGSFCKQAKNSGEKYISGCLWYPYLYISGVTDLL